MSSRESSFSTFLAIDGCHVFVTGGSGGVGSAAVKEFLENGCKVTAFDKVQLRVATLNISDSQKSNLHQVLGDLTDEASIAKAFQEANDRFGTPQILIANAGITDESTHPPIWEIDAAKWDKVHSVNVRGTFLTVKQFLLSIKKNQERIGKEMENVSIVITGSETGVFGQEGHAEYSTGKAGVQYGLVKSVKNEIVRLNSKGRINAVAPGWIDTPLIGDRLDDPYERWAETEATVALKKIAQPTDVARCISFLSSHRAAGHISGQCISVDGGQEGRLLWREAQTILQTKERNEMTISPERLPAVTKGKRRLRVCVSIDFDAISGLIGTGHSPENTLADYSSGLFGARVGVDRLLRILQKHGISQNVTWFIPGHSMESFPKQTAAIVQSGAEIGLHGYSHESSYAMSVEQERDVLRKCIELATGLCHGKKPVGYRAPLYQIRESTVQLLQENNFLYDSSLNEYDSVPYLLPEPYTGGTPTTPDYTQPASTWMKPFIIPEPPAPGTEESHNSLVEIPASWYTEDATPMCFYPHLPNTQGYISTDIVEKMWLDRFDWLWDNESWLEEGPGIGYGSMFPIIWHPECAGRSHIIGMIDRFLGKVKDRMAGAGEGEITFETMENVAKSWKQSAVDRTSQ